MIVDDSKLIRKKITREYDRNKFELVASAENGIKAVDYFKTFNPEVVTMDLTMPLFDGIQCIEQLVDLNPKVKILVISALKDWDTCMEALEKGAQGFITKPVTQQSLIDALDTLIEEE